MRCRSQVSLFAGLIVTLLAACGAPAGSATVPSVAPPINGSATPASTATPARGQARTDSAGVEQVWVPAGTFSMGTSAAQADEIAKQRPPSFVARALPSQQPQHSVRLTSGYWIDRYEVTNAAFQAFVDAGGYRQQAYWSDAGRQWLQRQPPHTACSDARAKERPREPCVRVTWYEAEAYARWRGGRLPTEAEWEYAARGPESTVYPWGNGFDADKANVVNSTGVRAVGSYPAGVSWVSAHDLAGNAMEWVQDWLDPRYYQSSPSDDPPGPATGKIKIEKGGWWGSNPFVARAAYRHFEDPPEYADEHIGFRIVSR